MQKQRFVIVGTGGRGLPTFAKGFLAWPEKGLPEFQERAQIAALVDIYPSRAQAALNELKRRPVPYDIPLFTDLAEAICESRPDWVVVCVPDHAHAEVCVQALELGVNVLVEKPLAPSVFECRRILEKAREKNVRLRVAHNYRHMRWCLLLERLVREGRVGRVLSVEAGEILGNQHGGEYFHRWHSDYKNSCGMLSHKACHHFDVINWVLKDRPVCAAAFGSRALYQPRPDFDHASRCDDCKRKSRCAHFHDLDKWDGVYRRMYRDSEHHDGYVRDRCVFDDRHTIYDNYHVNLQFSGGVLASYVLTNFGPREHVFINLTGTEGCIESGHDTLTGKEYVRLIKNDRQIEEFISDDEGGMDGHGGADLRMVGAFLGLKGKYTNPESLATAEEALQAVMGADLANRSLARGGVPVWAEEAGKNVPPAPPQPAWSAKR